MFNSTKKPIQAGPAIKKYLREMFPIIGWLPHYNRRWLYGDLTAGLTIGVMLVPQGIAYARLAGLPVEYGLYSALVGVAVYAIFGTSKDISVGPTSVLAMYIGQGVREVAKYHGIVPDNSHLAGLASAMALLIGCMVSVAGMLRLGIIIDFISAPVVVGFTFGAAVDIMVAQLPKLFGIPNINTSHASYATFWDMLIKLGTASLPNLGVGISAIIMLVLLKMLRTKLGHRSRIASMIGGARIPIVVVFYTLVSFLVSVAGNGDDSSTGQKHPLNILRNVPRGIPKPQMPPISFSIMQQLFLASMLPLLQAVVEHVTISKALGRIGHYHTNNSQELLALGASNVATSFFSGFCGTGAMTRGMILSQSGVRSPLSGLFASIIVCCALIFLPPAFYYIPDACLAAIIVTSVVHLMRGPQTFIKLWRINPLDSVSCFVALIFTVMFNIAIGIGAAVGLSLLIMLYKVARPDCIFLEPRIDNPNVYVDPALPDVVTTAAPRGIIVFRPEEALIFPNAHYIRQTILRAISKRCASGRPPIDPQDDLWCNAGTHDKSKATSTAVSSTDDQSSIWQRVFRRRSPANNGIGNQLEIRTVTFQPNLSHNGHDDDMDKAKMTGKTEPTDLPAIRALIIDCAAMSNIDASGLQMLLDIKSELIDFAGGPDQPFEMHFVGVKRQVLGVLEHSGITGTVVPVMEDYEDVASAQLNRTSIAGHQTLGIDGTPRNLEGQSITTGSIHPANRHSHSVRNSISPMMGVPLVDERHRFVHYSVADAVRAVLSSKNTCPTKH